MTQSNNLTLGPKFLELNALVKEGTTEWRNKESIKAEQKFLRAAEVRGQLYSTGTEVGEVDVDMQKVDKILSGTLNNFAVINLENNRTERALELANRALELLQKAESFDEEYFETLDLLKEIHEQINKAESASMPKPTIKPVTTRKSTAEISKEPIDCAPPAAAEPTPEKTKAAPKKKSAPKKK